jgi:hypothetical protein
MVVAIKLIPPTWVSVARPYDSCLEQPGPLNAPLRLSSGVQGTLPPRHCMDHGWLWEGRWEHQAVYTQHTSSPSPNRAQAQVKKPPLSFCDQDPCVTHRQMCSNGRDPLPSIQPKTRINQSSGNPVCCLSLLRPPRAMGILGENAYQSPSNTCSLAS